jgi:hypothetical protein
MNKIDRIIKELFETVDFKNEPVIESVIDRAEICKITLIKLEEIDDKLINNIKWETRIDNQIKDLNLDSDTDMDIDFAIEKAFGIKFTKPISPPTFKNLITCIEDELKKLIMSPSKLNGLLSTCNKLYISLKIRSWLKNKNSVLVSFNMNLKNLKNCERSYLERKISENWSISFPLSLFDNQSYRFFIRTWPAKLNTIKDLAEWIEKSIMKKRNELASIMLKSYKFPK